MPAKPASAASNQINVPLDSQSLLMPFELAKIFLRNKPAHLTCREYASELIAAKKNSATNPRQTEASSSAAFEPIFNAEAFWKNRAAHNADLYAAARVENELLRNRNAELESQATVSKPHTTASSSSNAVSSKRSARGEPAGSRAKTRSKRLCTDEDCLSVQVLLQDAMKSESFSNLQILLSSIYHIQRLSSSTPSIVNHKELGLAIERCLETILQLATSKGDEDLTEDSSRAMRCALAVCLKAMKVIDQIIRAESSTGKVVFAVLCLFHGLVNQLWECLEDVDPPKQVRIINPRVTAARICWSERDKHKKTTQAIETLIRTLIALFARSAATSSSAAGVTEGILYLLLQRAGPLLFQITFGGERDSTSIIQQIRDCPQERQMNEAELKQHEAKAKFLMPLLRLVYKAHSEACSSASTRKVSSDISRSQRVKMQQALKQAIFGAEGDKLTNPLLDEIDSGMKAMKEYQASKTDVNGQWLIEELWRLLGHEVLDDAWYED